MLTNHEVIVGNSNNMKELRNESIDLVVTSPPYPMIEMWDDLFLSLNPEIKKELENENGLSAFNLMNLELEKIWTETDRVLKPGGIITINIGDATRTIKERFRIYSSHTSIIKYFEKLDYDILPQIIWRKQTNKPNKFMGSGMLPTGAYVTLEHEFILIFRKPPRRKFNKDQGELRRKSSFFWEERNKWFSDVWMGLKGVSQIINNKKTRDRSAAYPLDLAYRLINMYSVQGDTVLDPFLGTGTTIKAAMICGRNSVGYEIDDEFTSVIDNNISNIKLESIKIQESRISEHKKFVEDRLNKGKIIKHHSDFYNYPVMTKSEIDMRIPVIEEIIHKDNKYSVKHSFERKSTNLTDFF